MSVKIDLIFFKIFRKLKSHGYLIANRYVVADVPISINRYDAYPHIKKLFGSFVKYNNDVNNGDWHRLVSFVLNIEKVLDDGVPGDLAELGVWKGNTASILAYYAKKNSTQTLFI